MIITETGITGLTQEDRQKMYDAMLSTLLGAYKDKSFFDNAPDDALNKGEWLPELIEWLENITMEMRNKWTDVVL